jgi:hypothetical protein
MQTFIEAKNATILTANFVLLANFDKMPLEAVYFKIALMLVFVSAAISVAYSLSSFFPNVCGTSDQKSVLFFGDTTSCGRGSELLDCIQKGSDWPLEPEDVANQIVVVSKIVSTKTVCFSHALAWFVIAASVFVFSLLLAVLIGAK